MAAGPGDQGETHNQSEFAAAEKYSDLGRSYRIVVSQNFLLLHGGGANVLVKTTLSSPWAQKWSPTAASDPVESSFPGAISGSHGPDHPEQSCCLGTPGFTS